MPGLVDFEGKVGLITGAGQGVGREAALGMAELGARAVVVNDYRLDRAEAVASEVMATGCKALPVQADITDLGNVFAMFKKAEDAFGAMDVLVNNAGNAGPADPAVEPRPFWETGPQDWAPFIDTNFYGLMNCCRAALPAMTALRRGRIVTVVSDAGRVGEPHLAAYSGAKAGAAGFMRAIAKAVGRYDITANSVSLSTIRTPGVANMLTEEAIPRMLKSYVIRRLGEPGDAANMILFLASDAASWITGQTYSVNGGYAIG